MNQDNRLQPSAATTTEDQPPRVTCPPAKDPAIRLFIVAAMLLGFGIACFLDRNKYPPPPAWDMAHINEVAGYVFNHWGPYVLLPAGTVFGVWGVLFLRRRLTADAEGIGYEGDDPIPWSHITRLDATDARKGIVLLEYGEGKVLKLDSWKLRNFRELVALIERQIPLDKQIRPQ